MYFDTDRIRYGCGGIALVICCCFGLMIWWYARPETAEQRVRGMQTKVAANAAKAEETLEEAAAQLEKGDYSMAYSLAVYEALGPFEPHNFREQDAEARPGLSVKDWLAGMKAKWREEVVAEFNRQNAQFDREPLVVADRLETLAEHYKEFTDLKTGLQARADAIMRHRVAAARRTVYVPLNYQRDDSRETPFESAVCFAVTNTLASKVGGDYRFLPHYPQHEYENRSALLVLRADVHVYRRDYLSSRTGQETIRSIAHRVDVSFSTMRAGRFTTSWSTLQTVSAGMEPPEKITGDLYRVADRHEEKVADALSAEFAKVPPFALIAEK